MQQPSVGRLFVVSLLFAVAAAAAAAAAARGQMLPLSASSPVEGPCQAVDFELEMVCSSCS
jgi:hypothetical protein